MPSPEPDSRELDNGDISLIDRSLTDMLASGGLSAQPTPSASGSGDVINSSERAARLEAQITAAAFALEHELSEQEHQGRLHVKLSCLSEHVRR